MAHDLERQENISLLPFNSNKELLCPRKSQLSNIRGLLTPKAISRSWFINVTVFKRPLPMGNWQKTRSSNGRLWLMQVFQDGLNLTRGIFTRYLNGRYAGQWAAQKCNRDSESIYTGIGHCDNTLFLQKVNG